MNDAAVPADPEPVPLPGNRWQVQMLGGLQLRCGDIHIRRFPDQPTRLLFARLALQAQVAHGRDSLAQALWPEVLDADGRRERADASTVRRQRLRRTLSKLVVLLRAGGGPQVEPVHAERETLRLNAAAFDIDVHRFDGHCARGRHAAARVCYGGELLPGLGDEWVDRERTRLAAARARLDEAGAADADVDADTDTDTERDEDANPNPAPPPMTLPPPRQHFFGRGAELDQLRRALHAHRLVTLIGPGGCGKTALAEQVARRPQGFAIAAIARLEDCTASSGIVDRLRVALELQRDGGDALPQIAAHLDGARTLLVLDNFEQLVGPAAQAELDRLLRALPNASLLLTSRRGLSAHDDDEAARGPEPAFRITLRTLPLPEPGDDLAAAARNPGVALFVAAAQAARADFSLNRRNLAGVIAVCRQLEGLPLAIELAAAKVRVFAPRDMAIALAQSAKLLTRTTLRRPGSMRHASLAMALAWSWGLLSEPAREALRSLATFRGGWTLAQARALLAPPGGDARQVDALLAGLGRDSLLQAQGADGGPARQGLLAVLREFVIEQCSAAQLNRLRQQHRALFLAEGQRLVAANTWPAEADDANAVEALETACADGDDSTALGLVAALAEPWRARGASAQAIEALRTLARRAQWPTAARVELLALLANLLVNAGQGRQAQAEVALALQLAGDDAGMRLQALLAQSQVLWRADRSAAGRAQSQALLAQSEALLAGLASGSLQTASSALTLTLTRTRGRLLLAKGAVTLIHLGQADAAAALFEQAERLFSVLGDRRTAVVALPGRVACLLQQKHYRQVITVATKGEREASALGDQATRLQLFDRLNAAYEATGQFEQALQACQRQTRLARRHGLHHYASYGVWNQCHPLALLGQHELAARLLAFACRRWYEDNGELDPDDKAYVSTVRQLVGAHLGAARLRAAWARGQAMSLHEALELASGRPGPQRDRTP